MLLHLVTCALVLYVMSCCGCEGFRVAVISRDSARLDKLKDFVSPSTKGNLITLVGNVGEWPASR